MKNVHLHLASRENSPHIEAVLDENGQIQDWETVQAKLAEAEKEPEPVEGDTEKKEAA